MREAPRNLQDGTLGPRIAMTMVRESCEGCAHRLQLFDLLVKFVDVLER
jgi:hypothetical protein